MVELCPAAYRLLIVSFGRVQIVAVLLGLVVAACSSDGSGSAGALSTVASSTTQPTTATTELPALSDSGQAGFDEFLGTAERACVDVDQIVATAEPKLVGPEDNRQHVFDIRSGEFLVGNFAFIVDGWSTAWPDGEAKIYWIPFDHRVAMSEVLEVTVEPLDRDDAAVVQTFGQPASNAAGVFWPSGTKFTEPGRYRLTATAPGHWGCFEVTV